MRRNSQTTDHRPPTTDHRPFLGLRVAVVLSLAGLIGQAPASPPTGLSFPQLAFKLPKAQVVTLPNGMKLYLLEDRELPMVEGTAYIRTGSVYVPGEKMGLAGLFGATQRGGGTKSRTPEAINETLDQIAASVGTSVTNEYATATFSVMKSDLDTGLAIFADVLMNPAFGQQQVDLEKAQMLEGLRRRNDDPQQLARREFFKKLYGADHPYGREPSVESVSKLTREDLVAFHQRYYHPNNMMLAISGDFRKDDLIARLKKAFSGWKQAKVTWPTVPPVRRETSDGRPVYVIPRSVTQSSIFIGQIGVSRHDPDRIPLEVLNYILGGAGFGSRLMTEVRSNRGLAYSVGSIFTINEQAGALGAYSFTRADATVQATSLILDILRKITKEPVTADELRVAQQSLVNSFVFRFEESHEVVTQQMVYDYFKYPKGWLESYPKRVQEVTAETLLRVAAKHLNPDRAMLLVLGDSEKFDGSLSQFGTVQTITPADTTASRG
jgi:predicted Zn-dependent peptidase